MSSNDFSGAIHHYNPDKDFQTKHILLNLEFDLVNQKFSGSCSLTLISFGAGAQSIRLNACEMHIQSCLVDGVETQFAKTDEQLFVYSDSLISLKPRQSLQLVINYSVEKPTKGIYFVQPNEHYPDKPFQAWSQGESQEARYWYPCLDAPNQISTTEVIIKAKSNFKVLSNGLLVDESIEGDYKLTHWLQDLPHPNYLMAVVIGELAEVKSKWRDIEVSYFTHPSMQDRLEITAAKTPKMIEFYSNFFKTDYPWKKYYQAWVQDFNSGGMENTTLTINTNRALIDPRAALDYRFGEILVAHELSHQWFGDLIVVNHWSELWIKEGAATYSEHLWMEHEYGTDELQYYRYQEISEYLLETPRITATNYYRETDDLYDGHSYGKAGLVYHYIRTQIGNDELFRNFLQELLDHHKHQTVSFNDLIKAAEVTTGRNIRPILDQFILRSGHPKLSVSYSWDETNKLIKLGVKQTQYNKDDAKHTLFSLPKVKLGIGYSTKDSEGRSVFEKYNTITLDITEVEQNFYIHLDSKPAWVSLDPGSDIPKAIELEYSSGELSQMLKFDPNVNSRILAAMALGKKSTLANLKILNEALQAETFWGVKASIVKAITKINLDQTLPILIKAVQDVHPRVRLEAVVGLSQSSDSKAWDAVYQIAATGDTSYLVEGASLTALGKITQKLKADYISKTLKILEEALLQRIGWNEIVRSSAIRSLLCLNDNPEALNLILNNTKIGTSQYLRVMAISALGKVSIGQEKSLLPNIIETLSQASKEDDMQIEYAVITACQSILSSEVLSIIRLILNKTTHGRNRRPAEEAIEVVQNNLGSDKTYASINQKLDKLEKENQNLKSRIEEIENAKKPEVDEQKTEPLV